MPQLFSRTTGWTHTLHDSRSQLFVIVSVQRRLRRQSYVRIARSERSEEDTQRQEERSRVVCFLAFRFFLFFLAAGDFFAIKKQQQHKDG